MINLTSSHSDQSKQLSAKANSLASMLFANNTGEAATNQDASFLQLLQNSLPGMSSEQLAALMAGQNGSSTSASTVDATDLSAKSEKSEKADDTDASLTSLMAALLGASQLQLAHATNTNSSNDDSASNSSSEDGLAALGLEANTAAGSAATADVAVDSFQQAEGLLLKNSSDDKKTEQSNFSSELLSHLQEVKGHQHTQATETTTTTQASNTLTVDVPVSDDAWGNAMSQRVLMMAGQDMQSAELQLNPPNLGPVSVRLDIQNQEASVTFSSPHLAVREAIQSAAPQLIEMFSGSGLNLGNVNVGSQQQDQRQAQEKSDSKGARSIGGVGEVAQVGGETVAPTTVVSRQIGVDGLAVDTFI